MSYHLVMPTEMCRNHMISVVIINFVVNFHDFIYISSLVETISKRITNFTREHLDSSTQS